VEWLHLGAEKTEAVVDAAVQHLRAAPTNNGFDQNALLAPARLVRADIRIVPKVGQPIIVSVQANLKGLIARPVRRHVAAGRPNKPDGIEQDGKLAVCRRIKVRGECELICATILV